MSIIVQSYPNGVKYEVFTNQQLGREGGFGIVYMAKRVSDGYPCVFKKMKQLQSADDRQLLRTIRENLERLSGHPIMDADTHQRCEEFIGPMDRDSIVRFDDGTFGYVMELVDTQKFIRIPDFRKRADIMTYCKACKNITRLFRNLHLGDGWCYKDLSDGNVFADPVTGDVRIIDCDNISRESVRTVLGTPTFIAPEVYETLMPDRYSDYFSMALLFYKIFTGQHPLLGKRALNYMYTHNKDIRSAQATIFGTEALFVFDPLDNSNSIRGYSEQPYCDVFKTEVTIWDMLPDELRATFTKTFTDGLKGNHKFDRPDDRRWMVLFDKLMAEELTNCSNCKRLGFSEPMKNAADKTLSSKSCWFCGKQMPRIPINEPQSAVFTIKRNQTLLDKTLTVRRKEELRASLHPQIPDLSKPGWLELLYHPRKNMLAVKNHTSLTWIICTPGHSDTECPSGEAKLIFKNSRIIIKDGLLELTVKEIR